MPNKKAAVYLKSIEPILKIQINVISFIWIDKMNVNEFLWYECCTWTSWTVPIGTCEDHFKWISVLINNQQ